MAVFRYKTYDNSGKLISGVIDADSASHATSKLKSKGLFPFEVSKEAFNLVAGKRREGGRIAPSELAVFTRQLATLAASGMPLVESLTALSEQTSSGALKKTIADVKERVSSGSALSDALSSYPRYFSSTYVNLVRAGETSGSLDEILEELADLGERQEAIKGKVTAALAYPVFMTFIGTGVLAVLFILVLPKIISIFDNMGRSLPLPTRMLIGLTDFIHGYWPFLLAGVVLLSIILYRAGKTKKGREQIDRLLLRLPFAGNLLCKLDVSRFSRTLALLLKGGVPVTQALDIAKETVKNSVLAKNIALARENIAEGGDLASTLKEERLFPPLAVHMIAVGEKGGSLEGMLLNVANSFDREIETLTGAVASILEPLLIVAMGIVVGFIAMAILLPIFDMNMMVR